MALLAIGSDCEAVRDGLLAQPANALSSLAYVAAGLFVVRVDGRRAVAAALVAVGIGSLLFHGPAPPGAQVAHDGSIVVMAATIAYEAFRRRLSRPPPATLVAAAAAVPIYLFSRTGAALCSPGSVLQGHALWHILTAVAIGAWLAQRPAVVTAHP